MFVIDVSRFPMTCDTLKIIIMTFCLFVIVAAVLFLFFFVSARCVFGALQVQLKISLAHLLCLFLFLIFKCDGSLCQFMLTRHVFRFLMAYAYAAAIHLSTLFLLTFYLSFIRILSSLRVNQYFATYRIVHNTISYRFVFGKSSMNFV